MFTTPSAFVPKTIRVLLVVAIFMQFRPPLAQAASPAAPTRQEPLPAADQPINPVPMTAAPVAQAAADPVQESLAVVVALESDSNVLILETTATVTVTVRAELAVASDKATLTLTLPQGVVTTAGDKNKVQWRLPILAAGDRVQQRVQVEIDKVNQALKRSVDA